MTRSRATADTQDNNGGSVAPFVAGKNRILNSDFSIWQRGTSQTYTSTGGHGPDRWRTDSSGAGTVVISQQTFTPGTAPVVGYEGTFFCRVQRTVLSGGTDLSQRIEDVRVFANQTITVSFWAKADASRTVEIFGYQFFGSGGSADVGFGNTNVSFTTSWQRFTVTMSAPSISGKTIGAGSWLGIYFRGPNALCTLDYWGVQVEAGSVATPFTTATGNPASELAACQRYYYKTEYTSGNGFFNFAYNWSTTQVNGYFIFPVPMRVAPTVSSSAASTFFYQSSGNNFTPSAISFSSATQYNVTNTLTCSGLTTGQAGACLRQTGTAFIEASAEL